MQTHISERIVQKRVKALAGDMPMSEKTRRALEILIRNNSTHAANMLIRHCRTIESFTPVPSPHTTAGMINGLRTYGSLSGADEVLLLKSTRAMVRSKRPMPLSYSHSRRGDLIYITNAPLREYILSRPRRNDRINVILLKGITNPHDIEDILHARASLFELADKLAAKV